MRLAPCALLVLAAAAAAAPACGPASDDSTECPDGCPTAPTPTGCTSDASCGDGNVCANDGACYPAAQIRIAHVTWTVAGQPASAATCAGEPDLQLDMTSTTVDVPGNYGEGWAPVPCAEGEFTFQKMPVLYDGAELDPYGAGTATARGPLDGSGEVALDLE